MTHEHNILASDMECNIDEAARKIDYALSDLENFLKKYDGPNKEAYISIGYSLRKAQDQLYRNNKKFDDIYNSEE